MGINHIIDTCRRINLPLRLFCGASAIATKNLLLWFAADGRYYKKVQNLINYKGNKKFVVGTIGEGHLLANRIMILVIASIVLLARRPDSFVNPQFWAEDGSVFFIRQYIDGFSAIAEPYSSYLHLIPRLIACFSESFFNYSLIPTVYNYSCYFITLFVIYSIYSDRLHIKYKGLFALSLVLIPHYKNEVFMNITNLQWFLALLLVILSIKDEPSSKYGSIKAQYIFDILVIAFCGLTGPFLVLLSPLFFIRWIQNKSTYRSVILFIVCITIAVQLSILLNETTRSNISSISMNFNVYIQLFGQKLFGGLFLGDLTKHINDYLLSSMYLSLILLLFWYSFREKDMVIWILLYVHFILLLATIYKFQSNLDALIPIRNGQRYFYIPYVMIVWSLIYILEKTTNWKKTIIVISLLCILCSSLSSRFTTSFVDYEWKSYSNKIGKENVSIPINPTGWKIVVNAPK